MANKKNKNAIKKLPIEAVPVVVDATDLSTVSDDVSQLLQEEMGVEAWDALVESRKTIGTVPTEIRSTVKLDTAPVEELPQLTEKDICADLAKDVGEMTSFDDVNHLIEVGAGGNLTEKDICAELAKDVGKMTSFKDIKHIEEIVGEHTRAAYDPLYHDRDKTFAQNLIDMYKKAIITEKYSVDSVISLITVKNFIRDEVNHPSVDSPTVKKLLTLSTKLQKKIISELMSDQFATLLEVDETPKV
jgi:hypothetical protein